MKKRLPFLLIAPSFISCKKDSNSTNSLIKGNWKFFSETQSVNFNGGNGTQDVNINGADEVTFNSNNTGQFRISENLVNFTYVILGSALTLNFYYLSANHIVPGVIKTLTAKELEISRIGPAPYLYDDIYKKE